MSRKAEWQRVFRQGERHLSWKRPCRYRSGQATVEAAFLIPLILLLLMLLMQPGIILYSRMVMQGAAAEGCRMLATRTASDDSAAYEAAIRRHLGAVPQQDNFHIHSAGCSWEIVLRGDEGSGEVAVSIEGQMKPLPLFDFGMAALGLTNEAGAFVQRVEVCMPTYGAWVGASDEGLNPSAWVQASSEGVG